jgi:hypothetical protein
MSGNSMTTNPVDPGDARTFELDYTQLLADLGGATIATSEWDVPDGVTQVGSPAIAGPLTKIKLDFANTVIGRNYTVYNRIETNGGDKRRRAMIIPVRDSSTFSQPSEVKATLDAIRAAIARVATAAQRSRSIGGTTIEFMSMQDLIIAETKWQQLYNQERRAERLRSGAPFFKNVHTRFVRPQ